MYRHFAIFTKTKSSILLHKGYWELIVQDNNLNEQGIDQLLL